MTGTLYVVGTPIGNLEDISLRALRALNEADIILCEDTRVSKKLLVHYGIATKTLSYHAHTDPRKAKHIIDLLKEGKNLALISDAGTPSISDPGSLLVMQVRNELGEEARIVAVPGPSAVVAALSLSGLPASDFLFLGFLPHKKGRMTLFNEIASSARTVAFYESPHRILKALETLKEVLGDDRTIVVCRELTKMYESVVRGSAGEVYGHFKANAEQVRGEFVVLVGGK